MKGFDQQVRDWAASKPAGEAYDYFTTDNCAICQFLREAGICDDPHAGGLGWRDGADPTQNTDHHRFSANLREALKAGTFGALAERLS